MDNKCIRVGIVNYLNTRPLIFGLQKMHNLGRIELSQHYPSEVAQQLLAGKIDIGLVPVAIIPELKNINIVGNYCIAANGPVASVSLYSKVPIENIKKVYLDFQSRTSIKLVQILFNKFWQQEVEFLPAPENFIDLINEEIAGGIIGDRALKFKTNFEYEYDLAEAWKAFTGLPFVFAAWVSSQPLSNEFMLEFDRANSLGFAHLNEIVKEINYPFYDLEKYFTQNIDYVFSEKNKKGLEYFLKMLVV